MSNGDLHRLAYQGAANASRSPCPSEYFRDVAAADIHPPRNARETSPVAGQQTLRDYRDWLAAMVCVTVHID